MIRLAKVKSGFWREFMKEPTLKAAGACVTSKNTDALESLRK